MGFVHGQTNPLRTDVVVADDIGLAGRDVWDSAVVEEQKDTVQTDGDGCSIAIEVLGGVVVDVRGLPAGWTYDVVDRDET